MNELPTLAETGPLIRSGKLHPRELVEACLARIHAFDARVRAWVEVDEVNALCQADSLGREAASGAIRGPLHGAVLGVKDIIDAVGMPTRAGSPLRENHRATADAPVVAALRRAGAIILGKTVTVEFACFDPSPTRNPWDRALQHTPGGSSSGSAAAVAMRMCQGALGTQTGGSLVRPSTYCGIAACKPTFGLLSRRGIVPVSYHFDHPGPMARTAADLAILLRCMTSKEWSGPALDAAGEPPAAPPRLGWLQGFFLDGADAVVRQATVAAVDRLRAAGATIEPVETPAFFEHVRTIHRRVMAAEAAAYHRASFAAHRSSYGPMIAELLDEGLRMPAVDYADALAAQRHFIRLVHAMFDRFEVLLCPATDTTAPATLATTGTPKFQAPWSCAGTPAVSIPCGLASDGMPAAIQLVARRGRDAMLLDAAEWCERALAFTRRPPLLEESPLGS